MTKHASKWLSQGWVLPPGQVNWSNGFLEIIDASDGMEITWVKYSYPFLIFILISIVGLWHLLEAFWVDICCPAV